MVTCGSRFQGNCQMHFTPFLFDRFPSHIAINTQLIITEKSIQYFHMLTAKQELFFPCKTLLIILQYTAPLHINFQHTFTLLLQILNHYLLPAELPSTTICELQEMLVLTAELSHLFFWNTSIDKQ